MRDEHQPIVILLADDDEEDRMLTCEALTESRLSNDIHCVTDGEDLMDYLRRQGKYAAPGAAPRPGLILLDLNMPKKDGREALREIKADPELQQIPVVVMTTSKDDEDLYSSYDSGASSFIGKPVTFEGLVDLMKGLGRFWFGKAREMKNETIKVLLIEDDEDDYILTRGLLSEEDASNYVLDWAPSYEEGLKLAGRGEHQVCLVDYRLGERTGVQLIREARESRLTTPMILLTGQGDHDVDVEAMQAGATGYLVKDETHSARLKRTIRYAVELNTERCRAEERLTERRQVEVKLEQERDAALETVRLESEFLAKMSHEMRTPMNSVIGMTGSLLETDLTSPQRNYTETIQSSTQTLLTFIDNILDFSKIDAGLLRIDDIGFELRGSVEAPGTITGPEQAASFVVTRPVIQPKEVEVL